MTKLHEFNESLSRGAKGELIITEFLQRIKAVESITDLSSDPFYQQQDIDMLLTFKDGTEQTIEVKTDFQKTPNLFYETISAVETNSIGCFEKTKADRMIYYFCKFGFAYIIDIAEMRKWVKVNSEKFNELGYRKELRNRRYDDSYYTSVGYAIPRTSIEQFGAGKWLSKVDIGKIID